jgi:hypothetical protein
MTSKYCYANMGVLDQDSGRMRYAVIRIWAEKVGRPDIICATGSFANVEMISTALNATIGLTDEQAEELSQSWIAADIDKRSTE